MAEKRRERRRSGRDGRLLVRDGWRGRCAEDEEEPWFITWSLSCSEVEDTRQLGKVIDQMDTEIIGDSTYDSC